MVDARKAAIGVLICFRENITKPMRLEAKKQGYYDETHWGKAFDRIQLLSVEDILEGERVAMPESRRTVFKTAKYKHAKVTMPDLFEDE